MFEPFPVGMATNCFQVANGVHTSIETLCAGLRELGWSDNMIHIIAPAYRGRTNKDPQVVTCPSVWNPLKKEFPLPLHQDATFRRSVGQLPVRLWHSHHPFALGPYALKEARRRGNPIVATCHTRYLDYAHYVPLMPSDATKWILRRLIGRFFRECDAIIVPSQYAATDLARYGVTKPYHVIPTGVPTPTDEQLSISEILAAQRRYNLPKDAPTFLFVGRLSPEKNLDLVLRAFTQVAEQHGNARLVVVGDGDTPKYRKMAHDLGVGHLVTFTGPIPHSELPAIYAQCTAFVFASTTETQGLVIGEAKAAGCPAVTLNKYAVSEFVRDGIDGLTVGLNAAAFAQAMCEVIEQPELRRKLSEGCIQRAANFSPQAMARRIVEEVYMPLLTR